MRNTETLRWAIALAAIGPLGGGGLMARETLGVYRSWAAFRDASPRRCFAIAEPEPRGGGGRWRAFAAISAWPDRRVRGQLHIHLRARKKFGAAIILAIGEARFPLIAGGADAWAPNAASDARIVAAMRGGRSMSIETTARDGRPMVDVFPLRGAPSAIDAATLACLPPAAQASSSMSQ